MNISTRAKKISEIKNKSIEERRMLSLVNKDKSNLLSNWIDSVYELFQTEEEDSEDQNLDDNISYEESQIRLIILGLVFATLFASIATINSVLLFTNFDPIQMIFILK